MFRGGRFLAIALAIGLGASNAFAAKGSGNGGSQGDKIGVSGGSKDSAGDNANNGDSGGDSGGDTDEFPRPDDFLSSEFLKTLNLEQLTQVADEMNLAIEGLRAVVRRGDNVRIPLTNIQAIARFQTQEALEALVMVFNLETKRIGTKASASMTVYANVVESFAAIGTNSPKRFVNEFLTEVQALQQTGKHPDLELLGKRMIRALKIVQDRPETIVNLNDLLMAAENAKFSPEMLLDRAEGILSERLIGQPEVLQAFLDLEWRSSLYGASRTLPDVVYLAGPPGTGKDTGAEALTDALHGYKGAHVRHLFRLPLMKSKADLWQLLGSSTGYVGSENFPPFLEFVVLHSGGKYKIDEVKSGDKKTYRVVENPEYKGVTLPGYFAPNTGVVFANEFHNWSKQLKDDFMKQALEKGVFTINNPNGGLSEIYVPIRFLIASNEGIRLLASREANGQRHGQALTYDQMIRKWDEVHDDKRAIKAEILATNGSPNASVAGESAPGISEELLNRIPERYILLLRPLSPDHLQQIAVSYLNNLKDKLTDSPLIGKVNLTWSAEVPKVLQEYDYIAEENARPILGRVSALIEEPLLDALRRGGVVKSDGQTLHLDIQQNPDGSRSLLVTSDAFSKPVLTTQLIRATTKDIAKPAISDERIDELGGLDEYLKENVFGIDEVLERLAERVLSIENEAAGGSSRPVNVLMLNGLSSTGKTETAKQLAKFTGKGEDNLVTFDFSQIQTLHDFKVKILGLRDGAGNPIPSEFMKAYDRANGQLTVAFDELANVRDIQLMTALYDFFRESVVRTFSDGKPRPMGGVKVIITGNPGQELYSQVPRHVPMEVQMLAWEEISRRTNLDPELQRKVLEKYYPEPLITRIGRNNIFFLPPHSYRSLRQLAQLKLGQSFKRMALQDSRRGWNIMFPSSEEYARFIDTIIAEGFSLRYQGASIESFVRDDVEEKLKYILLKNKIPSGEKLFLKFRAITSNESEDTPGYVFYDVVVPGQATLELKIRRPYVARPLDKDETNDQLTAFHEAGHSLVRTAAFNGAYTSTRISIIPGVSMIGDQWIYYAGIAQAQQNQELFSSRDWAVRQIAILMAGESAERLVSQGSNHSAGKSNDIERATRLARDAIIRYGLSAKWGLRAVPTGTSNEDFIGGLSEREKNLLGAEVNRLLDEGRQFAEQTIEANFADTFIPLGIELSERGVMNEKELREFYEARALVDPSQIPGWKRTFNHAKTLARKWNNPGSAKGPVQLDNGLPRPRSFADIRAMAEARKQQQYASVPIPANAPIEAINLAPAANPIPDTSPTPAKQIPLDEATCEESLAAS